MSRALVVGAAAVLAAGVATTPASAVPPSNDEVAGARAFSLGDHITQDTHAATTTAADAALNVDCGAPATRASVWYSFTAPHRVGVWLETSESSYSTGLMVFEGAPSPASLLGCGPGAVSFGGETGTTYTVMVFDDDGDGNAANGGLLVMDVIETPPPPSLDVTVNPRVTVDRSGSAWITGTYSCLDSDGIELDGRLDQAVGRFRITGWGSSFAEGTCNGSTRSFAMEMPGDNGRFAGGRGTLFVEAYACNDYGCADEYVDQRVKMSKGHASVRAVRLVKVSGSHADVRGAILRGALALGSSYRHVTAVRPRHARW